MGGPGNGRDRHTGLYDGRYFWETLEREVVRAHRYRRSLALVLFDLDDFRRLNDEFGHATCDLALKNVADRLRGAAGAVAVACRIGGDDFAVILPESKLADASKLSARLASEIASGAIHVAGPLKASFGAAELERGEDAERFIARADLALYEAKRQPPPDDASGVREPRRPKPSGEVAWVRRPLPGTES